jgi:arylsulfatase A-like enzyme
VNLNRRTFIRNSSLACASLAINSSFAKHASVQERPNVILIMTDDQGYGDLGATGNPVIRTPNIDAMAKRSGSMANFYVSPVCSPTRACLMTGRYNYRTRVVDTWVGRSMMDPQETTIAEILRTGGYSTGIFGKWHLGDNYPMRSMDQGFDESLIHRGGGIGQPADPEGGEGKYTDAILFHNGEQVQTNGYCTDVYFDSAMKWIESQHKEKKNFFAYIPTNAPHGPFHDVPEEEYEYYKTQNLNNDQFPQNKGHKLPKKSDVDKRARIFAMIDNVDQNVGRLFKKLNELNLTDNTMVIFMVDNGPNGRRYVSGMRGMKTEVYEGGIRTPFFVHWPSRVEPGVISNRIAAHIDLLPTITDACGVSLPEKVKIDGRSLLPLFKKEVVEWSDRTIFIQAHRGNQPLAYHNFAARSQNWKLLHASGFGKESFEGDPKFELYDMVNDPLETTDLADKRPDVLADMRAQYERWFKDVSSTRPNNYAPPRITIGTEHDNPSVLTRQDWRHARGRTWAKNSNGFWELYSAQKQEYNIRVTFTAKPVERELKLNIGKNEITKTIPANASECSINSIAIPKGNTRLQAFIHEGSTTQGPWQIYISW